MTGMKWRIAVVLALGIAGVPQTTSAQLGCDWIDRTAATGPGNRSYHALAFDSTRRVVVLFGGYVQGAPISGETWEYDGTNWTRRFPKTSPSARAGHAMFFDPTLNRVILFGGYPGIDYYHAADDTWEWDGMDWTRVPAGNHPPERVYPAIAWDADRNVGVLFGGSMVSPRPGFWSGYSDTWTWSHRTWTQQYPATSPRSRVGHALAHDARRKRMLMFGGTYEESSASHYLGDTWEWDGSNWHQCQPAASPSAKTCAEMAFEPRDGRILLFAGWSGSANVGDTWAWNGTTWSQLAPLSAPKARSGHRMVTDSTRDRIVLFGGSDGVADLPDTWEFTSGLGAFALVGQGCPGSHFKTPALSPLGLPRLGQSFHLSLADALPLSASLLILDITDPNIGLGPFGAPGCTAHVNPHMLQFVIPTSLTGTWYPMPILRVPHDLALLGGVVYFQAFIVDPAANRLGAVATAGLKATVGF